MSADIYPLDSGSGAPRSWEQIRADALTAARAAGSRRTSDIVDAVLSVVDDEAVERMTARLLEDTRLRSMDFRNGARMDMEPSRELAALWVGAARGMLGEAVNYCETEQRAVDAEAARDRLAGLPDRWAELRERIKRDLADYGDPSGPAGSAAADILDYMADLEAGQ